MGSGEGRPFSCILLALLTADRAARWAHPIDMYAQTQAITISANEIQIDWKITPGPLLADAIWSAADQDKDGSISTQEAQAWSAAWLSGLSVSFDNQNIGYAQIQAVHWPGTVDVMRTGEDSIEMNLSVKLTSGLSGTHTLEIHNSHLESNSL